MHNVSELPLVPKWRAVKVKRSKKTSILLLKQTFFFDHSTLTARQFGTSGSHRRYVPHFKGLIELYLDLRSSRAWHYFYLPPRPKEKGHFTPKTSYCPIWFAPHCIDIFCSIKIENIAVCNYTAQYFVWEKKYVSSTGWRLKLCSLINKSHDR